jgi:AraC-like DNA-binding protein
MLVNRHSLAGPMSRQLRHREHIDWHDPTQHQLIYPSQGVLSVRTERGSWVVPPRRAVWLPAGVPHSHRAYGETQMRTLALDSNPLRVTEPTVLAVSALLREVIVALTGTEALTADDRADLYRVALRRLTPTPALRHHLPTPADPRLRDVAAILTDDPADQRTLTELGREVGASERTLSRLLRRDTAMTFPRWRAQLRLQHSMILLAAGHSVTDAATASGYSNVSAYIAAFREAFGVTPAAYCRLTGGR